jgi:hypothetical protein
MGRTLEDIDETLAAWIAEQALFFVGTAPLDSKGHVNISPKGPIGSLRVLDPRRIAYLDVIGSGAETIAHLRENGRIVIMLCAFSGLPRILRIHGRGRVIPPSDPRFAELLEQAAFREPAIPDARRALVVVDVMRVATSCGFGVPLMSHEGQRTHADDWARKKIEQGGAEAFAAYQREKNALSLDDLPAVDWLPPA